MRDDAYDEKHCDDWRVRMARRYYNQLYKEFAIIDLSRYKEGKFGLRWRTESEVISSKGQRSCGSKLCENSNDLNVFEMPFKYSENGTVKRELIKVCLCPPCSEKLSYGKGDEAYKHNIAKDKLKRTSEDFDLGGGKKGRGTS